jgi:hypothetical protein
MDIKYRMRKLPEYQVQAREVVRVLDDRPHLLVRMEVRGESFPHRAPHPFVMIQVGEQEYFKDLFTEVSADNQSLQGYLPIDVPSQGVVVFGYGDEIWGRVPGEFDAATVTRLDRKRLPEEIVVVDVKFLRRKK